MLYNISLEINIEADSPLEAAKEANKWIKTEYDWAYYVREDGTPTIYSIDLQEEDENAVIEIKDYKSIIET